MYGVMVGALEGQMQALQAEIRNSLQKGAGEWRVLSDTEKYGQLLKLIRDTHNGNDVVFIAPFPRPDGREATRDGGRGSRLSRGEMVDAVYCIFDFPPG